MSEELTPQQAAFDELAIRFISRNLKLYKYFNAGSSGTNICEILNGALADTYKLGFVGFDVYHTPAISSPLARKVYHEMLDILTKFNTDQFKYVTRDTKSLPPLLETTIVATPSQLRNINAAWLAVAACIYVDNHDLSFNTIHNRGGDGLLHFQRAVGRAFKVQLEDIVNISAIRYQEIRSEIQDLIPYFNRDIRKMKGGDASKLPLWGNSGAPIDDIDYIWLKVFDEIKGGIVTCPQNLEGLASVINANIEQIEHLTHLIETSEDNAKLYIIRQVFIENIKSIIEEGCNNAPEK